MADGVLEMLEEVEFCQCLYNVCKLHLYSYACISGVLYENLIFTLTFLSSAWSTAFFYLSVVLKDP